MQVIDRVLEELTNTRPRGAPGAHALNGPRGAHDARTQFCEVEAAVEDSLLKARAKHLYHSARRHDRMEKGVQHSTERIQAGSSLLD